jgi:hypothetical protein
VSRFFYYLPLGRNCYSGDFVRMKLHFLCHSRTLLENSPCFSLVQLNAFQKPSGLTEREGSVRVNFDTFESVLGRLIHPQLDNDISLCREQILLYFVGISNTFQQHSKEKCLQLQILYSGEPKRSKGKATTVIKEVCNFLSHFISCRKCKKSPQPSHGIH